MNKKNNNNNDKCKKRNVFALKKRANKRPEANPKRNKQTHTSNKLKVIGSEEFYGGSKCDSGCFLLFLLGVCVYRLLSCRIKIQISKQSSNIFWRVSFVCIFSITIFYSFGSVPITFCVTDEEEDGKKLNLKLNKVNCRFCQLIDWFRNGKGVCG